MDKGGGSLSLKKHRRGSFGGKSHAAPSGMVRIMHALTIGRAEIERAALREKKKILQGFVSIQEWLASRGR
jgi:hypothetical protein